MSAIPNYETAEVLKVLRRKLLNRGSEKTGA
jgi:hypothetical protein